MSDEEKEAIEILKLYFGDNPTLNITKYVNIVLNLIEKQSKEIEELKTQIDEHVYYDLGGRSCGKTELLRHYKKGYDMNNKFWKDKIKATIEELEKLQKEFPNNDEIRIKIIAYKELLEKE